MEILFPIILKGALPRFQTSTFPVEYVLLLTHFTNGETEAQKSKILCW